MAYRTGLYVVLGGILMMAACRPEPETPASVYAPGDTITVTGTLIDARCFAEQQTPERTADAAQARDCSGQYARQGFPVAVLENDPAPTTWVLVTVPQALADYVTGTVRVTGAVRSKGVLIPHRIELQTGDAWTFIM